MRCTISVLVVATCCLAIKLPQNFKKCSKNQTNFQQCLVQSAQQVLSLLDRNIDAVGLTSLAPFDAGFPTVPKGSKYLNFEQKYNFLKFLGFKNAQISKFEIDLARNLINLEFVVPELKWDFELEFSGTLYSEPVEAKSLGTAIMKNVKYVVRMVLEEQEEIDGKHLVVIKTTLGMDPTTVYSHLNKVTRGTKDVTEWFNKKVNDNYKTVWGDVKSNYDEFFGELVASNFNRFFEKVPLSELF